MKKILLFCLGAVIIFGIQFFCSFILKTLHLSFPAPILGIIVLFLLLKSGIIKIEFIENFCNFLLKNMILFFIPLFAGVVTYSDIILKNFYAIILTIFITTTLVMVTVGLFVENAIKFKRLNNFKKSRQQ